MKLHTLTLGVLLAVTPLTALADGYPECVSEPSDEEVEAAKGAFMAGKAAFDEADYDRAITYWSDAYRRDCTAHDLLRNLARAYELSGQKQAAIAALQTYLERVPDTPKREQFQLRIDKLNEQLAEEAKAPTPPAPDTTKPDTGSETPVTAAPVPATPPPRGKKPVAPLVVAGVGGVVAIVGGVGYVSASGKVGDYEEQCGPKRNACPTTDIEQKADDWRSRQIAFGVTSWVGIGLAATGVVWYLAAPRKVPRADAASIQPVVGPGFTGLAVAGHF